MLSSSSCTGQLAYLASSKQLLPRRVRILIGRRSNALLPTSILRIEVDQIAGAASWFPNGVHNSLFDVARPECCFLCGCLVRGRLLKQHLGCNRHVSSRPNLGGQNVTCDFSAQTVHSLSSRVVAAFARHEERASVGFSCLQSHLETGCASSFNVTSG